jgi:hypothetical protein
MNNPTLNSDLEKLRQEVNLLVSGNDDAKAKLNVLINDIELKISTPDEEIHDSNLTENIRDTITQFETEHPRTTAILNDIMVSLSNMGI